MANTRSVLLLGVLACLSFRSPVLAESFTFQTINDPDLYQQPELGPLSINNGNEVVFVGKYFEPLYPTLYSPPGTFTALAGFPPNGECSPVIDCGAAANAINNKGEVIGTTSYQTGVVTSVPYGQTFLWTGNSWRTVQSPYNLGSGYPEVVYFGGLNDAGQVVGTFGHIFEYHNDPENLQVAIDGSFLWQNGISKKIADPAGSNASTTAANDINDRGEIVGSYTDSKGVVHGFTDTGGVFKTLDFPQAVSTRLNLVNNAGQITGVYTDAAGNNHSFFYSGGKFIALGFAGDPDPVVNALNNYGEIVGQNFVYDNGEYQSLNLDVTGVNDSGVIVGVAGPYELVIGYPGSATTPEPSNLGYLTLAGSGLLGSLLLHRRSSRIRIARR